MKKIFALVALLLPISLSTTYGQNSPIFSHFYANPFQFNPSFAANNGYSEANLFYRKQFLGISNAPTVGALNFQAPVGRNVSLGFTAYSEKSILLSSTSALGTFAYRARLGHDHHLNFGLSAGMGFNNFDFEALEGSNDPALQNITQNNSFLNGQFGVNYHYKNFTVGFALPKIFQSQPNSPKSFNEIKFDEFRNKFASASYTIQTRNFSFMPMAIYRALDNQQDQWEGAFITTYKQLFWIGASYRTEYGITGMVGVNLKGLLRIGYAYEHPTGDIGKVTNGSHEVYLGMRLGKQNREEKILAEEPKKDTTKQVVAQNENVVKQEEEKVTPKEEVKEQPIVETQPEIKEELKQVVEQSPLVEEKTPIVKEEVKQQEKSAQQYYLVVGVYHLESNANRHLSSLKKNGYQAEVVIKPKKDRGNYYYLYIFRSASKPAVLEELSKVRDENKFGGAWIYAPENRP